MDQRRITELIEKVYANTATEAEIAELDLLYLEFDQKPGYTDKLNEREKVTYKQTIYNRISDQIDTEPENQNRRVPKHRIRLWFSMAAVLLISALMVFIYHLNKPSFKQDSLQTTDIKPGGNVATLTLSNGQKVVLTDLKNGTLANEDNTSIQKTNDGQVVYSKKGIVHNSSSSYNMMTTPTGGQYALTLSDGTKVMLNAASTLKYPVCFSGKDRIVELTGEAYFEVAHDKKKPFKVIANHQVTEVLGTHFNINSYADEDHVKTVLIEGSVKVYSNAGFKILKPGQQSTVVDHHLEVSDADVEETLAWKNGYFRFNDENITSVMRKLSRWYNIEVQYQDKVPEVGFYGTISKFKNISEVLKMLEYTKGVHFKVEGRRVTVGL